jgi:hypothetical protein
MIVRLDDGRVVLMKYGPGNRGLRRWDFGYWMND